MNPDPQFTQFMKRCSESLLEYLSAILTRRRQCGIERADGGCREKSEKSRQTEGAPDSGGRDF